jgi:hypothetical protein
MLMKKMLTLCLVMLSLISTAHASVPKQRHATCPQAVSSGDAAFCGSFHSVANCHCVESGVPVNCDDLGALYDYMVAIFGSLDAACSFQEDTDKQTCIDDWNCYRNGGSNSLGQMCNASGNACQ